MAAYAITRQRTLRGMGATFSFVPRRRRGLSGLGDSQTGRGCYFYGPDGFTIESVDTQSDVAECTDNGGLWNNGTPFVYTDSKPIIPKPVITPVTPPVLPGPAPVQVVFPSSAKVPPPPKYAAVPVATSWLDQQMIAGLPNSYLALATAGLVLMISISSAKRRR